MSDREIAARQLWHEFRGYAYTRANCTVMWPWNGRTTLFASVMPMATWDLPMRCFDVSSLDDEALSLDERVRREYGDRSKMPLVLTAAQLATTSSSDDDCCF